MSDDLAMPPKTPKLGRPRRPPAHDHNDPNSPTFTWPLGARLKERRAQLGMTNKDLAQRAGVSVAYVEMVTRGSTYTGEGSKKAVHPSAPVITRIATALGLPPAELFALVPNLTEVEAPVADPTAAAEMPVMTLAELITQLRPESRLAVQALVERLHEGDQALAASQD